MITCLKHKVELDSKVGKCMECLDESISAHISKGRPKLLEELVKVYNSGLPIKIIYISDLSNNLSKVHQHMNESVDFSINPGCTITLTHPSMTALKALQGGYQLICIDNDLSDKDFVIWNSKPAQDATVLFIEPIKQEVL